MATVSPREGKEEGTIPAHNADFFHHAMKSPRGTQETLNDGLKAEEFLRGKPRVTVPSREGNKRTNSGWRGPREHQGLKAPEKGRLGNGNPREELEGRQVLSSHPQSRGSQGT